MLDSSQLGQHQMLEPNFDKNYMNEKTFEKINIKIAKAYNNVTLQNISINLENVRFWDQTSTKKDKNGINFEK